MDIVERLGNYGRGEQLGPLLKDARNEIGLLREFADQLNAKIVRLRAEIERLKAERALTHQVQRELKTEIERLKKENERLKDMDSKRFAMFQVCND